MKSTILLTVKEAADLCGVSPDTIHRWISKGVNGRRLKSVKTGITRIRRSAIDEFLSSIERAA